ncbi:MAG: hypothetical protein R2837_00805 [Aliarcobacter sp.]
MKMQNFTKEEAQDLHIFLGSTSVSISIAEEQHLNDKKILQNMLLKISVMEKLVILLKHQLIQNIIVQLYKQPVHLV